MPFLLPYVKQSSQQLIALNSLHRLWRGLTLCFCDSVHVNVLLSVFLVVQHQDLWAVPWAPLKTLIGIAAGWLGALAVSGSLFFFFFFPVSGFNHRLFAVSNNYGMWTKGIQLLWKWVFCSVSSKAEEVILLLHKGLGLEERLISRPVNKTDFFVQFLNYQHWGQLRIQSLLKKEAK